MKSSNSPNKNIHFFYNNNISFIKAGKGYDHKGKPVGTVKGRCKHKEIKEQQTIYGIIPLPQECNGTIIALKISTNNKGFETTIEHVCDKCGFVTSTASQVLNKETKNYKTTYYTSHEDWLKQNKTDKGFTNPEDISIDAEMFAHAKGRRLNTNDNFYYGSAGKHETSNTYKGNFSTSPNYSLQEIKLAKQLGLKSTWTVKNWNRGTTERMHHKKQQHNNYVDICKTILEMNNNQSNNVKYLLRKDESFLKMPYDYEDIILCICLYFKVQDLNFQRKGTLISKIFRTNKGTKHIYGLIKQKIDNSSLFQK